MTFLSGRENMELPIKITLPDGFLDEEIRCGYTVTSKMKAVWAVELDLFHELSKVCDKYGIRLINYLRNVVTNTRLSTVRL